MDDWMPCLIDFHRNNKTETSTLLFWQNASKIATIASSTDTHILYILFSKKFFNLYSIKYYMCMFLKYITLYYNLPNHIT